MKKIIKINSLLFICCFNFCDLSAQIDFDLTQRWFNESIYNPAATGNNFSTGFFLHARSQWHGLEGAPKTQAVTMDTYSEEMSSAFGVSLLADQIGFTSQYSGRFSYAYYFKLNQRSFLSLGLSAGFINRNSDANKALIDRPGDPSLYLGNGSETSPDFDFGIEYKGPFKAGVSIRHLASSTMTSLFGTYGSTIWAYASSRFNLSQSLSFEPAVSFMNRGTITRIEFGGLFYFFKSQGRNSYSDKFWIGGMYRLNSEFAALAGVNLSPKIRLGYSFDYGLGDLQKISKAGTHEIFLSWYFNRIFYKDKLCPAYRNAAKKR